MLLFQLVPDFTAGMAQGQTEALVQANKLYVLAWIPEFPDSFMVLLNVVSESEYQRYCVQDLGAGRYWLVAK